MSISNSPVLPFLETDSPHMFMVQIDQEGQYGNIHLLEALDRLKHSVHRIVVVVSIGSPLSGDNEGTHIAI